MPGMDMYFTLLGIRFAKGSTATEAFNRTMHWLNLLVGYYLLVVSICNFRFNEKSIYSSNYLFFQLATIIGLHCGNWKRKVIGELLSELSIFCDEKSREKLKRFSYLYLAFIVVFIIPAALNLYSKLGQQNQLVLLVEMVVIEPDYCDCIIKELPVLCSALLAFVYLLYYPFILLSIMTAMIGLYFHCLFAIFKADQIFYTTMIEKIDKHRTEPVDFFAAIRYRLRLNNLKRNFEGTMNIFTFAWFVVLFMSCAGYLWLIENSSTLKLPKLNVSLELLLYVKTMSLLLILLLVCDKVIGKCSDDSLKLAELIFQLRSNDKYACQLVNVLICKSNRIQFTGWSMFKLNKSFLLSFVGGLLTFSVLKKQMFDDRFKQDMSSSTLSTNL